MAASNPQYAETMSVTSPLQNQEALGQGVVAGTKGMPPPAPTPLAQVPPGADTGVTATTLGHNGAIPQEGPMTAWDAGFPEYDQAVNGGVLNAGKAPTAELSYAQQVSGAKTPTAELSYAQQVSGANTPPVASLDIKSGLDAVPSGSPTSFAGTGSPQGFWGKMPDWAKYAALTSGAQGLTGLAGGYFQGLTAEEQLDLQKWIAQQNQTNINTTFQRGAYAPLLTFQTPGTLNTVKT